jgi:hypothetical protein
VSRVGRGNAAARGKKSRGFFQTLELFAIAFALAAPVFAEGPRPILDPAQRAALDEALHGINMTEADLGFAKDHGQPRLALRWVREALSAPLMLPEKADGIRAAAGGDSTSLWNEARALLEIGDAEGFEIPALDESGLWAGLDPRLGAALSQFMPRARLARRWLADALRDVSRDERSYLAASWMGGLFSVEDREPVRSAMVEAGISTQDVEAVLAECLQLDPEPAAKRFLDAAEKVHQPALWAAGREFQSAVEELHHAIAGVQQWPDGNVLVLTDLGKVRIGGPGDDSYGDDSFLIIEPGGDNTYRDFTGSADGLRDRPLAALIDLAGDDRYIAEGLVGQGGAVLGLAVLIDAAGNDVYASRYAGQGSAFCGAAWVHDVSGDDVYRGRTFAQGASAFGIGLLRDEAGNDVYDVGLCGQGFAGAAGLGWLVDAAGHDRYFAGGVEPDHERHDDRFLSLSQGFAQGNRPFCGGGVGILSDRAGNDTYTADVFGQGVSYYYAAGFLLDEAGHDAYRVFHYGQGSGIHLSHGLLADGGGDDEYSGTTLAQGSAHDYGVGMLWDRAGRDTYTAAGDSQGHGMNNALGLLVDADGDDAYFAANNDTCQGVGNTGGHRDYGSLALLLDLKGNDTYSCGVTNGTQILRPLYGTIYDSAGTTDGHR